MGRRVTKAKKKPKSKTKQATDKAEAAGSKKKPTATHDSLRENVAPGKPTEAKYTVSQLLHKAEEYIDMFEFEMAQKFCQRALELEPDNVQALETCGTLLLELGELESAKHCFGRAIEVDPESGYSKYMNMGQLMGGAEAIKCFSRGLELMLNEQQQQTQEHISAFFNTCDAKTKPPVTDRDVSNAHCSMAEIYLTDACFAEDAEERCRHHLEEAVKKDGDNPEAYHLLASFFLSKEEPESAKEVIEKGVSLWLPQMKEVVKPDGAAVDPVEVCAVSYPVRINATKILIELEEYDQASEVLELLLDEEDEVIEVWYLLGWLNYLQGQDCYTNARYYLQKAQQPKVRINRQQYPDDPGFTRAFTADELDVGITALKKGKAPGLDNIQTELIKQLGPKARDWLLRFFNSCTASKKIPKLWRQAKVVAILKPRKDPSEAKSFRPISLLCHTYKLFERLILNRLAAHVDEKLIPEQAGFRPGKSYLSAAYDTVNHRRLLSKVLEMTGDLHLTDLIRTMLESRRFFVVLNGKKSRWRRQKNGLPQGSVLAPMLFNIYTNDQPVHTDTQSFIYADDLCIASQEKDFNNIEVNLTSALSILSTYYDLNQLRANPSKTQVCAFHLRNRDAKRELNVVWNGTRLNNTSTPVYLGVHLDRTLSFKTHIQKTKMKVNPRNNIIRKLSNSKWGCRASTLRSSCLALCYSAAEYACPVWERSTHASKLNPALHDVCRIISGCLKPANVDSVHLLAGIAPHQIRRTVASRMERSRLTTDTRHQLFNHMPAASRLKSRKSFMHTVTPLCS
ncbi:putative RNA-directed DNA polymerase from transposon BS [Lamellibrachia satsuma]|nr:putative RNA-directed DNA polymerase from transposon BS [Lamellibrachia satsuma]